MSFLRNPLAWHKRYVDNVHDMPSTPAGIIGRAAHVALQHFYSGLGREAAVALGLEHLQNVADFEINFGVHKSRRAQRARRLEMEKELLQALSFYLARPPRYAVLGVEIVATAEVPGVPLPIKAISDLVVVSKVDSQGVDIVDHKFIDSFSQHGVDNPLFIMQALFNYYTVLGEFKRPVHRFILQECKKRKNKDGSSQMRRTVLEYASLSEEFQLFKRLLNDASQEISRERLYLPNPSDMFEGKNSFDIYRLGLLESGVDD